MFTVPRSGLQPLPIILDGDVTENGVTSRGGKLLLILNSVLDSILSEWEKKYSSVDVHVLVVYLTKSVLEFGSSFAQTHIVVPNW